MMLKEGVIPKRFSPRRSQIVVVKRPEKWRLGINYSQTINRYTQEDGYPMPRIDEMEEKLAKYSLYSKFDLKSAYHQIPISPDDRKYAAFEANHQLYEFRRIPFGLTNAVPAFQQHFQHSLQFKWYFLQLLSSLVQCDQGFAEFQNGRKNTFAAENCRKHNKREQNYTQQYDRYFTSNKIMSKPL